ncbi:hypothetical protein F511_02132 [Dorcoceras hygrometricum]|nr:hypothetical protein F511_02132 [Dorcoceras hygrometricum]
MLPPQPVVTYHVPAAPPPGIGGSNVTNIGSNRWLTMENWSLQVDAPAMMHRRDHLLVFAFVLPDQATNASALPGELVAASGRTSHDARRHDHLLVLTFVLPDPETSAGALPDRPPPGPDGSNETSHSPNHADNKKLKESLLEVCMLRLSSEIHHKPQMPPRRQVTPPPPPPLSSSEQVLAGLAQILRLNGGTSQAARTEMPYEKFCKMGPPEFTGSTDPFVVEGWVRTLETTFRYMRLEDAVAVRPERLSD